MTKEQLIQELIIAERATPTRRIRHPSDAVPLLARKWANKIQEHFIVITLNAAHEIIATHCVTKGTVNNTLIHPREVLRPALLDNAVALLIAHNHPSGNTDPSPEDRQVTTRLCNAAEIMGIRILDHIIFSRTGYTSFLEKGIMP